MDIIIYKINRTINNAYKDIKNWVDSLFERKKNDDGYTLIDKKGEKYMTYDELWEME